MAAISRISIRKLLYLAILLPASVMLALGLMKILSSYEEYLAADEALRVEMVANAGGELAQALPGEIFTDPAQMEAARKRTDNAYEALFSNYENYVAAGGDDKVIAQKISFIRGMLPEWESYRKKVDAAKSDISPELRNEGIKLQPIPGAAIDITRRSSAFVNDPAIGRVIQGFHALMQVNDAGLMELGTGEQYLSGIPLISVQKGFLIMSRTYFATYTPIMFEQLPTSITKPYKDFLDSEDEAFMNKQRALFYDLGEPAGANPDAAEKWKGAALKRVMILAPMIAQTSEYLGELARAKYNSARASLILYGSLIGISTLAIIVLSALFARGITQPLREIKTRMAKLADGDTESHVPHSTRSDEIGEMAHAVEYFRQGAIENLRLQKEAEDMRARSEAERAELQRKADEDAAAKLLAATGGLASALQRLAAGDMLCEVNEQFSEEFEGLRQDFNSSVVQLRDALTTVGRLSDEVNTGSAEISSASDNLAKRTEQQAASLEQTAAALEEITSNVTATTRRTNEARDFVRTASTKAGESAIVVGKAVDAMQHIEESSDQIGKIISVIDEIAFQTNLLALNAGVEAARAGEAGKGFAVVAQEVRELAQRSANAAREIKELITRSAAAVGEGVRLVNDTGEGLGEIEKLVLDINQHMDAIATAAEEQSTGLAQVNTAVNQMDQTTQQNAAMVEEMNAAGAGLASEAAQLKSTLSQFQLGAQVAALKSAASEMRVAATPKAQPVAAPAAKAAAPAAAPVRAAAASAAPAAAEADWEEF